MVYVVHCAECGEEMFRVMRWRMAGGVFETFYESLETGERVEACPGCGVVLSEARIHDGELERCPLCRTTGVVAGPKPPQPLETVYRALWRAVFAPWVREELGLPQAPPDDISVLVQQLQTAAYAFADTGKEEVGAFVKDVLEGAGWHRPFWRAMDAAVEENDLVDLFVHALIHLGGPGYERESEAQGQPGFVVPSV